MNTVKDIISQLSERRYPATPAGYLPLLDTHLSAEDQELIRSEAQRIAIERFGHGIYLRALIEVTNSCRNNCLYCGLRRDHTALPRYVLSDEEILHSCRDAYAAGLRTFVMQGGETGAFPAHRISAIVRRIKEEFPDCAITLSLGEWERPDLQSFFDAGADRYLLRHETRNDEHYSRLHPAEMSASHRRQCLSWLKEIGYQTGSGIMVGSPGQSLEHIAEDLHYLAQLQPEMIGIGPFLPHSATPFASHPAGDLQLTLRIISILRLMFPDANIPSTTALATLSPQGRLLGIQAGANVVMPNVSPPSQRANYSLYDGKAHSGAEAVEGIRLLAEQLATIGYHIDLQRGDFSATH